ncbi:extracellular solute-binding protein [Cohnella sp. REN36]|uniref:extracellular solute-binding protein n=1 Tax=Cohnella sp. REN36 TaxID=2887347 RepID=UPI001D159F79|nr:extracellular solute-binding protein [Cohnella sp. REN36]MCC3372321.1 extracellular solute-binding protein [Cohnella sp. REN36]
MRKNGKAALCLAIVLILSLVLFGCGSSSKENADISGSPNSSGSGGGGEITVWIQKYSEDPGIMTELMDDLTKKFKAETGITAKYELVDWGQALTKYTLASTGGDAPDVADLFFLQSFVKIGGEKFGPLQINDVAKDIGVDKFIPASLSDVKVGDDFYAIPWGFDTRVMVYNTDHFAEAGIKEPPTTWDELLADAKRLTKTDAAGNITRSGMIWGVDSGRFDQTWATVLAQAGGKMFDDAYSKATFDSPEGMESLQFMQDSVYKYKVTTKNVIDPSYDSYNDFLSGKASIMLGATSVLKSMQKELAPQMEGKYQASVLPSKSGQGPSSIHSAQMVSVMKSSKNIEAAKKWIKFFTSKEAQLEVSKKLAMLNSNLEVMADPYFTDDPWLSAFVEQSKRTTLLDQPIPSWSQISAFPSGPIGRMTTNIMAGRSVKDEVQTAFKSVQTILASNK